MDGVNPREKEKTIVQNLLKLTVVKRASSHSECFAITLPSLPDFALQVLS
jgi:hypothetical protein